MSEPLTAEEIAELRFGVKIGDIPVHANSRVPYALPRLLDEVERSRAWLRKARHQWPCVADEVDNPPPCTCGLAALLGP